MPPGVFYLLAGPPAASAWASVFEVSDGSEEIVTQGGAGHWIQGFAASRRGMAVSAVVGLYDVLERWTRTGPVPLHRTGKPGFINGVAVDVSPDGTVAWLLGSGASQVWARSSWAGRDRLVWRYPRLSGMIQPMFGPRNMLALAGPWWTKLHGSADVLILARDGRGPVIRKLRSGFGMLGYNAFWGPGAPALVIGSSAGTYELLYLSGRRQLLPAGWRPLAWSPSGRTLVLFGHGSIGLWSLKDPGKATTIGPANKGYSIFTGEWLASPVPGIKLAARRRG